MKNQQLIKKLKKSFKESLEEDWIDFDTGRNLGKIKNKEEVWNTVK